MDKYELAAKYLNLIQRAGARHSARDNDLVQQMHDRACELGAKCQCEGMAHPMLKAAVEALILRHPGHGSQKVHGNRFGGYSTTKESLRRLKGDKEARERYKTTARKKGGGGSLKQSKENDPFLESQNNYRKAVEAASNLSRQRTFKRAVSSAKLPSNSIALVKVGGEIFGESGRVVSKKDMENIIKGGKRIALLEANR